MCINIFTTLLSSVIINLEFISRYRECLKCDFFQRLFVFSSKHTKSKFLFVTLKNIFIMFRY